MPSPAPHPPLSLKMQADDNVAIVANDGGLAAGSLLVSGLIFCPGLVT